MLKFYTNYCYAKKPILVRFFIVDHQRTKPYNRKNVGGNTVLHKWPNFINACLIHILLALNGYKKKFLAMLI